MTTQRRVLVCDDQPEIRELAAAVLRQAGFGVTTAANGRKALESLNEDTADLVLLDINMPEMDGWETLRLIRADHAHDALPVVMFSVKGEISDKVTSLQEGAAGYITKPFGVDELIERIEVVLNESTREAGA